VRYGSVCSGIGSCRLAAPPSWECAWFSEIDAFASSVLAHRFPGVRNLGDFVQIGGDRGPIDVLVGGTPCQSFSVAGKRGGLDSPNGDLALEFARLARRVGARWVVWENVPGVFSTSGGRDFDTFLGALDECGYSVAWRVLDAQWFGVPQRRRRVFVVGYRGDWRPPAAVLFERTSLRGNPAPRREAGEDIAGTLGGGTPGGGPKPDTDRMTFVAHTLSVSGADASEDVTGRGTPLVPMLSPCLSARDAKGPSSNVDQAILIPHLSDPITANEGSTYSNAGNNPRLHNVVPIVFSCKDSGQDAGETAPTLRAMEFAGGNANGGGQIAVAVSLRGREGGLTAEITDGAMPALRASQGGADKPHILDTLSVRRLTPLECERLQGLPDGHTLVPHRGKPAADSQRYRAIGNGWAVPVVRWILDRLDTVDRVIECGSGGD